MIISYSELSRFQTCQRQYYYNFEKRLIPNNMSEAIRTGVDGHAVLQVFYEMLREGLTKQEAFKKAEAYATKMTLDALSSNQPELNTYIAWVLIEKYINENEFNSEIVLVEERFLFPASRLTDDPFYANIQIGFTPDVVFRRKGGFIDVEDSKFVGRAWSLTKINRFPQLKLYQIFLESMGYNVSRTTLRQFNTKTGKITPKNYVMKPAERTVLTRDFLHAVKDLARYKLEFPREESPKTLNYSACDYCSYKMPCDLEAEGKSAEQTMRTQYKKNDYDYNA